jgi:surface protein
MRRRRINSGYSYNTERRNIDDGIISSAKLTISSVPVDIGEIQASVTEWERPSDWLTLPDDTLYDDVFIGLVAIEPSGSATLHYNISTTTGDDFIIDWGDGFSSSYADNTNVSHSYDYDTMDVGTLSSRGYKQAVVVITPSGSGNIDIFRSHRIGGILTQGGPSYLDVVYKLPSVNSVSLFGNEYYNPRIERFRLLEKGPSVTNFSNLFSGYQNLQKVEINADTSNVTATQNMFYGCNALKTIPYFDTSNVTTMLGMFSGCSSLVYIPLLNTSKVVTMSSMFSGCINLRYVPELDTSKVTDMTSTFNVCINLKKIPKFNLSSCTLASYMFNTCGSLEELPDMDFSKITTAANMFRSCSNLKRVPKILKLDSVGSLQAVFRDCYSLQNLVISVIAPTTMFEAFIGCVNLKTIKFLNMDGTGSITRFQSAFANCFNLEKIEGLKNTQNVTEYYNAFVNCVNLHTIEDGIDINSTNNANDLRTTFQNCTSLEYIPFLTTGSGTTQNMTDTFNGCRKLKELPYIDTSNVNTFLRAFYLCTNITESPSYDFSNTTTLHAAYQYCNNLKTIPPINAPNATNSSFMFYVCYSLSDYSGSIDLSGVTTGYGMFSTCYSLRRLPPLTLSSMNTNGSMDSNTTAGRFFYFNYSLRDVELNGLTRKVDLRGTQFDRDGLVKIFNSLGTAAGSQVINITAVPGAADLSAADLLIATSKGWTVTY